MSIYQKPIISIEEIPLALDAAFDCFNDAFDTNYSPDNIKIAYYTSMNFYDVYRVFCEKDFPSWLSENPYFLKSAQASALVEGDNCGILINTSVQYPFLGWVECMTHELAHIFAVQHEYSGKNFYHECCCDSDLSSSEDMLYVGYTVWKEFIAHYLTAFARPYMNPKTLYGLRKDIIKFDNEIVDMWENSLGAMSIVLTGIFTSREHLTTKSKAAFLDVLAQKNVVNIKEYKDLITLVLDHLRNEAAEPHVISDDFIEQLGSIFRRIVMTRQLKRMTGGEIH